MRLMKISNREKNLLLLLFIAVGGYLFFTFVYTPQTEKLETLKQQEQAKQNEYAQMQALINSEGNLDLEIETIKNELLPVARTYFGDIDQEETIVILDDFAQKADLDIKGIRFSEPVKTSLTELKANEASASGEAQPPAPAPAENTAPAEGTQAQVAAPPAVSDNFTTRPVEVEFEGNYNKLMDYLVEVGSYYKRISSYSMQLKSGDDVPLSGTIFMNFHCVDSVDKYVPQDPSILEYNFIPRSSKDNPFEAYSWSYKITTIPGVYTSPVSQQGIIVGPGEQGMYYLPEQTKEDPISMEKTMELGAQNPLPLALNIFDEKLLYSFEDRILKTFALDKGNTISGKLEKDLESEENLYSITYTFDGEEAETEVYLDLQSKKLTIDKHPQYLSLFVNADKKLDNILGLIVTDAKGMDYRVFLANKIDWTNQKELRGVLPESIAYPLTVKNVFVRDNSDTSTKNAKLSFDELKVAYMK